MNGDERSISFIEFDEEDKPKELGAVGIGLKQFSVNSTQSTLSYPPKY